MVYECSGKVDQLTQIKIHTRSIFVFVFCDFYHLVCCYKEYLYCIVLSKRRFNKLLKLMLCVHRIEIGRKQRNDLFLCIDLYGTTYTGSALYFETDGEDRYFRR